MHEQLLSREEKKKVLSYFSLQEHKEQSCLTEWIRMEDGGDCMTWLVLNTFIYSHHVSILSSSVAGSFSKQAVSRQTARSVSQPRKVHTGPKLIHEACPRPPSHVMTSYTAKCLRHEKFQRVLSCVHVCFLFPQLSSDKLVRAGDISAAAACQNVTLEDCVFRTHPHNTSRGNAPPTLEAVAGYAAFVHPGLSSTWSCCPSAA